MNGIMAYAIFAACVSISLVFLLNGFGIIDQKIPAREMAERGAPVSLVPFLMAAGLFAFIVPATFVSHPFWQAAGAPSFQPQPINFFKNVAIWGGLLFIAAAAGLSGQ